MDNSKNAIPRWEKPDGSPVSCTEKVMVLNENYEELRSMIKASPPVRFGQLNMVKP